MTLMLTAVLAGAVVFAEAQTPAKTKTVVSAPIVYDYPAPATLAEFMELADAVVIARVKGSRDQSRTDRPRTDYDLDLVRVLKEHKDLGSEPKVCRPIGATESQDRIVRRFQPGFPEFTIGSEYLLFLTWEESDRCFFTAFGPAGVGMMDEATGLKPFTRHPVLAQLRGLNSGSIETRVVAVSKRR